MENNKGSSCFSLFETTGNIKCLYYAAALIIFQQGSGINVITFYSKTIFEESGSSLSSNMSSIVVAAVMTVTSVITITGAKFFKLRQLLSVSAIGNTTSMVCRAFSVNNTHTYTCIVDQAYSVTASGELCGTINFKVGFGLTIKKK